MFEMLQMFTQSEDPVDAPQHFLPAVVNTLTPTERCQSLSNDIR